MITKAQKAASTYITEVNAKLKSVTNDDVYTHAMEAYRDGFINRMQHSQIIEHRDTVANIHNALVSAWGTDSANPILRDLGII